jgi:predicted esterase
MEVETAVPEPTTLALFGGRSLFLSGYHSWMFGPACARLVVLACASFLGVRTLAQDATAAASRELPRGSVIERVACAGAPGQSYALYLPSTYTPDRAWPILYAFDPGGQGARPVKLAAGPAERFGWIVAGSNNSRNGPMPEIQAAVKALVEDTGTRFAIDERRVYATGFSGGARVATGLAMGCRGCVAGVFAQGAGLPAGVANAGALDAAWFAAAGERDLNYAELVQLEQELLKRGARQRFRVFAGGHEWAPVSVWDEALEWFELLAMQDGRRPRDSAFAASLFQKASARAAAFRERGELLDERREVEAIVRDFGAADTAAASARLKELAASPAYRKALDRQRNAIDEQARITAGLGDALLKLAATPDEGRAEAVLRANRDASELQRDLASAKDPERRLVHERALSQVYIQAMEAARGALRQQRTDSALELFEIAGTLRPQAPQPQLGRAQAQAAAGRKADAVRSLRRALELGLSPQDLARALDGNEAFAKLRDDPDVAALLATTPRP